MNYFNCWPFTHKFLILGQEETVEVDESLFDDLDLDGEEFDDDSEDGGWTLEIKTTTFYCL